MEIKTQVIEESSVHRMSRKVEEWMNSSPKKDIISVSHAVAVINYARTYTALIVYKEVYEKEEEQERITKIQ